MKKEKDWLLDYCLFMAIKNEQKGICWIDWPEELKDRHSKAVKEAEKELAVLYEEKRILKGIIKGADVTESVTEAEPLNSIDVSYDIKKGV